ncbi:MAG: bifunctional folylpolyglutamate synthase/dihydrofolate synthase [Lachnospiraceae bacterium]
MTYSEAEEYINNIPRFTKEKSEGNLRRILRHFGNPQNTFRYIHVAGTNGKGSVCAYLDSALRLAGRRTGLFTSPHLVTTAERMKVGGEDISEEEFTEIFEELKQLIDGGMGVYAHPTYFEWLYIMAMIWFSRKNIEYGVVETGLGGRLDATNIIENPAVTVITSISYDHMEILGDTIEKIAGEKAGIIKAGVPLICDGSSPEAEKVLTERARDLGAPVTVIHPEDLEILSAPGEPLRYRLHSGGEAGQAAEKTAGTGEAAPRSAGTGEAAPKSTGTGEAAQAAPVIEAGSRAVYQAMNSSLAYTAFRQLGRADAQLAGQTDAQISSAFCAVRWPARFEEIAPDIYVDGAHNTGGMEMLAATMKTALAGRSIVLVFAVANDKDYTDMIRILCGAGGICRVVVTQLESVRRTDLRTEAELFEKYGDFHPAMIYDIESAVKEGIRLAGETGSVLLCTGSLYLAGSILRITGVRDK